MEEEHITSKAVYVDSSDVIRIIKGYKSVYRDEHRAFDMQRFGSDRFFVQNLIFAGKIESGINVLPPHQHEIILNYQNNFGLSKQPPNEVEQQFDLDQLIIDTKTYIEHGITQEQALDFFSKNSIPHFKIAISTMLGFWKARMVRLLNATNPIVKITEESFDYHQLTQQPEYKILLDAFDTYRKGQVKKNINDSLALMILIQKVADFESRASQVLPIFYASEPIFLNVIRDTGLEQSFMVGTGINRENSIIRTDDYFIIHSIFSSKGTQITDNEELVGHYKEIEDLKAKLVGMSNDIFEKLNLERRIREYKTANFLRHIMFHYYQSTNYTRIFEEMNIRNVSFSADLLDSLNNEIDNIAGSIRSNLKQYLVYRNAWEEIRIGLEKLRRDFSTKQTEFDVLKDFGLVRFSLPKEAVTIAKLLLDDVLNGGDENQANAVNSLCRNLLIQNDTVTDCSFTGSLGVLWAMDNFSLIEMVTKDFKALSHQDVLLRCSAIVKNGKGNVEVEIEHLQELSVARPETADAITLGLAYISFHRWANHHEPFTVNELIPEEDGESTKAIEYALESFNKFSRISTNTLSDSHEMLRLYALNILIYYTTECGSSERFEAIYSFLNSFQYEKSNKNNLWHSRYTDTIARYLHRQYVEGNRLNPKLLQLACDYAEEAYKGSVVMKSELKDYFTKLSLASAR